MELQEAGQGDDCASWGQQSRLEQGRQTCLPGQGHKGMERMPGVDTGHRV